MRLVSYDIYKGDTNTNVSPTAKISELPNEEGFVEVSIFDTK